MSHISQKIKLISSWIQINTLFKTNDERKIRSYYRSIHKAMIITVGIHQPNKKFSVIVQPRNACKL